MTADTFPSIRSEAMQGHWTQAELIEGEQTGDLEGAELISEFDKFSKEQLPRYCDKHKAELIAAAKTAMHSHISANEFNNLLGVKVEEAKGCIDCDVAMIGLKKVAAAEYAKTEKRLCSRCKTVVGYSHHCYPTLA